MQKNKKALAFRIARYFCLKVEFGQELGFEKKTITLESSPFYIALDRCPQKRVLEELCHELGHFLVAPKNRRYRKDYGIPTGYYPNSKWDLEEFKACLVEKYLLKKSGIVSHLYVSKRMRHVRKEAYTWWDVEGQKMIDSLLRLI